MLHQHFASCPPTRGFPPKKQRVSVASVKRTKTRHGGAVRTANTGSPFNLVPFKDEESRLYNAARRLQLYFPVIQTRTKSPTFCSAIHGTKAERPLRSLPAPSPFLDIVSFTCGCSRTAIPSPKRTQPCAVKENEDKPGLSGRARRPYLV